MLFNLSPESLMYYVIWLDTLLDTNRIRSELVLWALSVLGLGIINK